MYPLLRLIWKYILSQNLKGVYYDDLKRHAYISWKSGSGKSELLKNIFYLLQKRTEKKRSASLILIDPHGDLAREVKNFHFNSDSDRVVYINPVRDNDFTPTINPFYLPKITEKQIDIRTQYLINVFKELLPQAQLSTQMEALLYPCIAVLLRKWDSSLVDLQRFMNSSINKDLITLWQQSPQEQERNFFINEFQNSIYALTKASLQSKLQSLINKPSFHRLVIWKNTLSIGSEMQKGSVLIFNLAKGHLWTETSLIFGRMIIAIIQSIAQSRVNQPQQFRKDCFLFIDECHNYISPSLDNILKEARKFGVYLILANQNIKDIQPSSLFDGLLNNTDVKLIGRNGNKNLITLSKEIGIWVKEFEKLKQYEFILKSSDKPPVKIKTKAILKLSLFQINRRNYIKFKAKILQKHYRKIEELENKRFWQAIPIEKPKYSLNE